MSKASLFRDRGRVVKVMVQLGAQLKRQRGSHAQYQLRNVTITVPACGSELNTELAMRIRSSVERAWGIHRDAYAAMLAAV